MKKQPEDDSIAILTDTYAAFDTDAERRRRGLPPDAEIELDLGCGSGSFTAALARKYPGKLILGADVMIGRVRKVARRNARLGIGNLVPLRVEARNLLEYMLPDGGVARLHLLCPDPWPKDRHRGHRLLTSDFVSQIHRVVGVGGVFHYASDDPYYRDAARRVVEQSRLFEPDPEAIADVAELKSDFELRWLDQGKSVLHLAYRAVPRPPSCGH